MNRRACYHPTRQILRNTLQTQLVQNALSRVNSKFEEFKVKLTKKLTYFELNGLAEAIRYIFHYTGQKFEDVRHDLKTWPIKEIKDGLPYGQFPLLEEDGKVLHQSLAIARYAAANTELLPSDPWEQAVLDAAALTVYDFDRHVVAFIHENEPVKKEEFRKKLYAEHLDYYFSRFEKQLKTNNGHFGQKLSWADFVFVGIIECSNLFLGDNIEKNYPLITSLVQEIQNLPGVKEYIRDRKPYVV